MIQINGSEGGGQILRTAVALSALTKKSVKITNIRGARPNPGLQVQHIEGIKAVAELCNAEVKGLQRASEQLEFIPNELKEKDLNIKISSAGSIGLVLQSLLIVAAKFKKKIKVKFEGGGTWGKWAPPVIYLEKVFLPILGGSMVVDIKKEGFFPVGMAEVEVTINPLNLKKINIMDKGKLLEFNIFSVASDKLRNAKVAERQAESARELLSSKFSVPITVDINYSNSVPGSGILVVGKYENSLLGGDSIGELRKRAEEVGKEAVNNFLAEIKGAVDRHSADMLLVYLALIKAQSKINTSNISNHIRTSIEVIEKFLPVRFKIDELMISCTNRFK